MEAPGAASDLLTETTPGNGDYEPIVPQGSSLQPTSPSSGTVVPRACASILRNEPFTVIIIMSSLTVMSTSPSERPRSSP